MSNNKKQKKSNLPLPELEINNNELENNVKPESPKKDKDVTKNVSKTVKKNLVFIVPPIVATTTILTGGSAAAVFAATGSAVVANTAIENKIRNNKTKKEVKKNQKREEQENLNNRSNRQPLSELNPNINNFNNDMLLVANNLENNATPLLRTESVTRL
ncbi:hypothetical protein [Spiroplasma endosymbiont of Andrena trimmerana]|uniref:hypothetical protein n=1 Tax=Spiroplasma endosymbiont of Andrena trimmerana TaxID=3066316 RepID=UPI0030CC17CE